MVTMNLTEHTVRAALDSLTPEGPRRFGVQLVVSLSGDDSAWSPGALGSFPGPALLTYTLLRDGDITTSLQFGVTVATLTELFPPA